MSRVRYELWLNRVRALSAKIISPFGISWGIRGHNQDTYANQESGWWGVLLRVGRTVGYNLRIPSTFNHLLVHGLIHQIYFDQKESIIRKTCLIMASFSSRPVPFLTSLPAFEDISGFRGYHLAFTKMMTKSNERTRREECLKKEYKNTKKSQSMEMMVMMRQNCRGSLIEPVICSAWPQVTNYKDALTLIYEKCLNNRLRVSHPCPSSSSCCLNDDPVEVHIICSSAGLPYVSPISHLGVSVFSFCMCEGY